MIAHLLKLCSFVDGAGREVKFLKLTEEKGYSRKGRTYLERAKSLVS